MPAHIPESIQRDAQAQRRLGVAAVERPLQGSAQIGMVAFVPVEPRRRPWPPQLRLGRFGVRQEPVAVPSAHRRRLPGRLQPLSRELADRLQHAEPRRRLPLGPAGALPHEAVVDEGGQTVQEINAEVAIGVAHGRRRLEGPAASEDAEAAEQGLLGRGEQVVAPGDRGAEGLLARRQVAGAAGEQRQPPVQLTEQRRRREHLAACRREFDGERQPIQVPADRGHRAGIGVTGGEVRSAGACSLDEQGHGGVLEQRLA